MTSHSELHPLPPVETETYLGDSVYASFDGWHIWLKTRNGLPTDPSNAIALEPAVLEALNLYAEKLRKGEL